MVKYKTETYESHYYYTPYDRGNSVKNESFVSNIPNVLGNVQLFDEDNAFAPQVNVYSEFVKNKQWKHCKKSDVYTHLKTGIKVKLEVIRSHALDYTNPSNGWEKRTLTVKIPQSDSRGTNINSHHNKKKLMV